MAKKAIRKAIPKRESNPKNNKVTTLRGNENTTLSAAFKTVAETHQEESTAFIRVWNGVASDDDSRLLIIGGWKSDDRDAKGKVTRAKDDSGEFDWYEVNVLGQTGFGRDLMAIRASSKPDDGRVVSAKDIARADQARQDIQYLLRVIRSVKSVGDMLARVQAKGYRFILDSDMPYKPIKVFSGEGKKEDSIRFSVPDFIKLNPEPLAKGSNVTSLSKTRKKVVRGTKGGTQATQNGSAATQGETAASPPIPVTRNWRDTVTLMQGVYTGLDNLESIAPAIAKSGLSPKAPDYETCYFLLRDLGALVFRTIGENAVKAWAETFKALPAPASAMSDKAQPKPETVPVPPTTGKAAQATMHKATPASAKLITLK
jgi:hypothetical protein